LRLREYFSFYYTSRECERGVLRFSPIKQGESLNSEISLSFLAIISEEADHTRALNGDRGEREEPETAWMHPGSANDVAVNADERKNTTLPCAFKLIFCSPQSAPIHREEQFINSLLNSETRVSYRAFHSRKDAYRMLELESFVSKKVNGIYQRKIFPLQVGLGWEAVQGIYILYTD